MFLSSAFLMIIALFYFVTGVTSDRIICEPLQNPTPSRVLNIVNRLYDVSVIHDETENQKPHIRPSSNTDFNISTIIRLVLAITSVNQFITVKLYHPFYWFTEIAIVT